MYMIYMIVMEYGCSFFLCVTAGCCIIRENVKLTNVSRLLETWGKEFLGSKYEDPISSFSDLQEFSVSNPEVVLVVS